jgi:hypothetical protein
MSAVAVLRVLIHHNYILLLCSLSLLAAETTRATTGHSADTYYLGFVYRNCRFNSSYIHLRASTSLADQVIMSLFLFAVGNFQGQLRSEVLFSSNRWHVNNAIPQKISAKSRSC